MFANDAERLQTVWCVKRTKLVSDMILNSSTLPFIMDASNKLSPINKYIFRKQISRKPRKWRENEKRF